MATFTTISFLVWFLSFIFTATFISQSHLLYKCLFGRVGERLSPPILINISIWCVELFLGSLLFTQKIFFTSADLHPIIVKLFGFLNAPLSSLNATISLSVIFLLLDRILILTAPLLHRKYRNKITIATGIICFIVSLTVTAGQYFAGAYTGNTSANNCTENCGIKHIGFFAFVIIRVLFGFINVILGFILIVLMYRYAGAARMYKRFKKANFLTIMAAATELSCNFIPNASMLIYVWIHMQEPDGILFYPVICVSIDALSTALIYRFIIMKKKPQVSSCQIFNLNNNNSHHSTYTSNKQNKNVTLPVFKFVYSQTSIIRN